MTTAVGYPLRAERINSLLRAQMESTTHVAQIIEMRRYALYDSMDYPPPLSLALDTLSSVATLSKVVDRHLAELVAVARNAGASWSHVGEALGVSRQAAHEHFRRLLVP